jgi:hypothetical protein
MTGFFDGWVLNKGYLHYSIDSYEVASNGANFDVTVHARQKFFERDFFTDGNRFEVGFLDTDWNIHTQMMEFDGEKGEQTFTIGFNPLLVMADPEEHCADATLDIYQRRSSMGYAMFLGSRIGVVSMSDSAFFRIEHNYVAPDPLKTPIRGLILSDRHYWKVDGIVVGDINATTQFEFINTVNTGIDDWLVSTENNVSEDLELLYRPDSGHDWEIIPHTGPTASNYGFVISDTVLFGEYTFAVWDTLRYDSLNLGVREVLPFNEDNGLNIYPNPAKDQINIESFSDLYGSTIRLFSLTGTLLFEKEISQKSSSLNISTSNLPNGCYIAVFQDIDHAIIRKKLLIQR